MLLNYPLNTLKVTCEILVKALGKQIPQHYKEI